jgi:hypothetical protein
LTQIDYPLFDLRLFAYPARALFMGFLWGLVSEDETIETIKPLA